MPSLSLPAGLGDACRLFELIAARQPRRRARPDTIELLTRPGRVLVSGCNDVLWAGVLIDASGDAPTTCASVSAIDFMACARSCPAGSRIELTFEPGALTVRCGSDRWELQTGKGKVTAEMLDRLLTRPRRPLLSIVRPSILQMLERLCPDDHVIGLWTNSSALAFVPELAPVGMPVLRRDDQDPIIAVAERCIAVIGHLGSSERPEGFQEWDSFLGKAVAR